MRIKVYKDGECFDVLPIDAKEWVAAGWSTTAPMEKVEEVKPKRTKRDGNHL